MELEWKQQIQPGQTAGSNEDQVYLSIQLYFATEYFICSFSPSYKTNYNVYLHFQFNSWWVFSSAYFWLRFYKLWVCLTSFPVVFLSLSRFRVGSFHLGYMWLINASAYRRLSGIVAPIVAPVGRYGSIVRWRNQSRRFFSQIYCWCCFPIFIINIIAVCDTDYGTVYQTHRRPCGILPRTLKLIVLVLNLLTDILQCTCDLFHIWLEWH